MKFILGPVGTKRKKKLSSNWSFKFLNSTSIILIIVVMTCTQFNEINNFN